MLTQMGQRVMDGLRRQRERVRRLGLDLDVRDDLTVWDDGDAARVVVDLLRELGLEPAKLLRPGGRGDRNDTVLPVVGERALAAEVAEKGPLTLFAGGSAGADGPVDGFVRQLAALAENDRLVALPMRHAVSLVERVEYEPHRVLVNGMPGAGNILLQRLVQLMQETTKTPTINQQETLLGMFAWDYREALFAPIHEMVLRRHPGADTHLRLTARDFVTRGWVWPRPEDGEPSGPAGVPRHRLLVSGLSAPTCMHTTFHANHEPMHAGVAEHYRRRGYRAVITLRHPLDVMVSIAAKSTMRPNGEREPERLLNDLDWFASVCDAATAYYRGYAELDGDDLLFVKYEELMADPMAQLRRLAAWLPADLNDEQLTEMWGQVADKSLTGRPEHYWKPGAGKYLKLLSREHVPIIEASGLAEAAAAMGYPVDLDTLRLQAMPEPLGDYPQWAAKKQHYDIHYHQVIGKRRTTDDGGIFVADVAAPAGGIDTFGGPGLRPATTVVSHDQGLFEEVVEWLGSAAYAALRDGFEPRCKLGQEQNRDFVKRMTGR